jgi:hypothetical protein
VKKIGFLSFGHWSASPGSQARSASDALLQSIDLAVAADELGADGAYFRVHHFARQLGSPFPLLAAVGARTSRIEIALSAWGQRYTEPGEPADPMQIIHVACGYPTADDQVCDHCGRPLEREEEAWLRPWRSSTPFPLARPVAPGVPTPSPPGSAQSGG